MDTTSERLAYWLLRLNGLSGSGRAWGHHLAIHRRSAASLETS